MRIVLNKIIALLLTGSAIHAAEEVTVYSYRHYEADQKLYEQFTAETGIKVNTQKAKADALITRIQTEGDKSPADLLPQASYYRSKCQQSSETLRTFGLDSLCVQE